MAKTDIDLTKECKKKWKLMKVISLLLNIGPLVGFTIAAYTTNTAFVHKTTLSATLFIAVIFTCLTYSKKILNRSRLWIVLIGLWICLDNILVLLIVFASCQIIDEIIVVPCKLKYEDDYKDYKRNDKYMKAKGFNKQT